MRLTHLAFFLFIALPVVGKAQQLASNSTSEADWYYLDSLARQVHGANNPDSSLYYFSLMEAWSLQQADVKWRRRLWRHRADMLYKADRFLAAIPDYRKAIEVYTVEQRLTSLALSRRRLAYSLRKTGDFAEARVQYDQSIEAARLAGDEGKFSLANAHNGLGNMYLNVEEFELAEANYLSALPIYEALNHPVGIAACFNNLALIHSRNGSYEQARTYFERSLALKITNEDHRGIANCYANLGDLAFELGDYSKAKDYHLQSIQIRDSLQLNEDATQSYTRMGEIAIAQNEPEAAIRWCEQSCDIAETGQFWESRIACHRCLYEAYRQQGKWQQSLAELEAIQSIQDSIDRAKVVQELVINEAREQFEIELSEAKRQKKQLEQAAKQSQLIRWILIGLLFSSVLLFTLVWRKRSSSIFKKQQAESASELAHAAHDEALPISSKVNDAWLQQFQNSLEQMIEARQTITTGILAEANHISERQLLRRIREQTALTTKQYIQETKLQMARKWLEEQRFNKVKDLAEALGFKSAQYFSKLFIERFGKAPSKYL